jgi:8-oxo-dGTP pyrophosphatase MutT (NUDIX family)
MEYFDLYDEDRNPLGRVHRRGDALAPGEYHIVVKVCVVNGRGELLLTLRDGRKQLYPGKWEFMGGVVLAGEDSRQGAARELREETGIPADPEALTLVDSHRLDRVFADVYLLRRDVEIRELTLQPGETVDARWATLEELQAMEARGELAFPGAQRLKVIEEMLRGLTGPLKAPIDQI